MAAAIVVGALAIGQNLGVVEPEPGAQRRADRGCQRCPIGHPRAHADAGAHPHAGRVRAGEPATLAPGVLTLGADNPAYRRTSRRSDGGSRGPGARRHRRPGATGKGFEGAVAYAVADKLGFAKEKVAWMVVPFSNSFRARRQSRSTSTSPRSRGRPQRATAVDLSDGYYFVNQSNRCHERIVRSSAANVHRLS